MPAMSTRVPPAGVDDIAAMANITVTTTVADIAVTTAETEVAVASAVA